MFHQENKVRVVGTIFMLASLFLTLIVLFIYSYFLKFLFQQTVPLTRVFVDGEKLHGTLSFIGP